MNRIAWGLCLLATACGTRERALERPDSYSTSLASVPAGEAVVEDRIASFNDYRRAVEMARAADAEGALAALESAIATWPANRAARVAYLKIHPLIDPTRSHRPFELVDSVTDIEVRLRLIAAHLNFTYRCFEARDYARAAEACEQILWLSPDYTVARMLKLDADILARDPGRHDAVLAKIAGLRALAGETEFGIPNGEEVGAPEPGVFRKIFEPLLQQARAGAPGVTPASFAPPRNDVSGECGMTPDEVEAAVSGLDPTQDTRHQAQDTSTDRCGASDNTFSVEGGPNAPN